MSSINNFEYVIHKILHHSLVALTKVIFFHHKILCANLFLILKLFQILLNLVILLLKIFKYLKYVYCSTLVNPLICHLFKWSSLVNHKIYQLLNWLKFQYHMSTLDLFNSWYVLIITIMNCAVNHKIYQLLNWLKFQYHMSTLDLFNSWYRLNYYNNELC